MKTTLVLKDHIGFIIEQLLWHALDPPKSLARRNVLHVIRTNPHRNRPAEHHGSVIYSGTNVFSKPPPPPPPTTTTTTAAAAAAAATTTTTLSVADRFPRPPGSTAIAAELRPTVALPHATMSPKGKSISLGQYSTFQYMLAPPSLARPIVERIPSVVFYGEPRDEKRNERDHYSLFATEPCTLWKYYLCCLLVLPSHALGMSEWGSGVVVATAAAPPGSPPPTKGEATDPSFRVLRRFRYSYYRGLLEVDTYHVLDENDNENDDNNGGESFRLVEFLSSPNQLAVWAFIGFFYAGIPAVLLTAKHAFGQLER